MSSRASENAKRVQDFLESDDELTFTELAKLVGWLKNERAFGDARKVLRYARRCPNLVDQINWITQQLALCTYKDENVHAEVRFGNAMSILEDSFDLTTTTDPETLGIVGAIHKHKWDVLGQKQDLEAAVAHYRRGQEADRKLGYPSLGYPGINAAYVLDCLTSLEENEARERAYSAPDAERKRESAQSIRRELIRDLIPLSGTDSALLESWWYLVTVAEAHFGLGEYRSAEEWLARARDLPNVDDWEVESTARQLASIARMNIGAGLDDQELSGHPAWLTLAGFLGSTSSGVRSAFIGKVGLALSGGGFRASLFHIGVLARLAELDVLRHVEVLSCVSGGSILGAYYYLEVQHLIETKPDSEIGRQDYIDIVHRLERRFLEGVQTNIRTRVFADPVQNLRMAVASGYTRTHRAGELYEEMLFSRIDDGKGGAPRYMTDLIVHPMNDDGSKNQHFRPKSDNWKRAAKVPILILNATSLNTGHLWQFTATWMGEPPGDIDVAVDSNERLRRMYYWEAPAAHQRMRLGYAVGSSACAPGVFAPLRLKDLYPGRDVLLVDGGVHDNQGTASLLEQGCNVVLTSDASGQVGSEPYPNSGLIGVPVRSSSIAMSRVRQAQFRELAAREQSGRIRGLMFLHLKLDLDGASVNWIGAQSSGDYEEPDPITEYNLPKELQQKLADIRTDLDSFSDIEGFALMFSGYQMTKLEFSKRITGIARAARDVPWRFQSIAGSTESDASTYGYVLEILSVASRAAAKIWVLSKTLRVAAAVTASVAFVLFVCLAMRPADSALRTVGVVGLVVIVATVVVLGTSVYRTVWWRETTLRVAVGAVLGLIGWTFSVLHLHVFDRLFLWWGSIDRLLRRFAKGTVR